MAKKDRGKKHTCHGCGAVFYDFNRTPVVCPKCETEIEVQSLLKPRRPSPQAATPKPPAPAPSETPEEAGKDDGAIEGIEVEDVEEEEDDDLMEDMSDIGDDDDDMSEVKEHISTDGDEKE